MTDKELREKGWSRQQCKIGTLYFKDDYFLKLNTDGTVDFYSTQRDMQKLGTASTLEELEELQKDEYWKYVHLLKLQYETDKMHYEKYCKETFVD